MPERTPLKKLSLVVGASTFEKVHYAFVMAAGAAATDIPVTMFFTMRACAVVLAGDGWRSLSSEISGCDAASRDADFAAKGVATMDELIESCAALGVKFMVCEMGLAAEGLTGVPIRDGLDVERTGVVTFLNDADAGGSVVYL